jgi:sulfur-oxidizing protein SoxY
VRPLTGRIGPRGEADEELLMSTCRTRVKPAALAAAFTVLGVFPLGSAGAPIAAADAGILNEVFKDRAVEDGNGLIAVDMPARAEDAAIVPVTMRALHAPGDGREVRAFTLIIDQNPAPVAATFTLGAAAGIDSIATRVRVEGYTNVHAVAELSDGRLYAVKTFVKASGGCSAPALKTADEAEAHVGELKFRRFARSDEATTRREAQIMVRHPNHSGMQMDPLSRLYVPALFVRELRVWQGEALVLSMEGGIAISENPSIRFNYRPNGASSFRAEVVDTNDRVFRGEWPADDPPM